MGLETGTYVSDLQPNNPANTDLESQGAAHLRLIKLVLQNTFPNANRTVGVPQAVTKTANYTIVKADANTIFLVDTTAAPVTLTLPTLAGTDDGWEISVIKTNTGTNPVLIIPPTGTLSSGGLSGLTSTRRCIPNAISKAIWTGTAFVCTRAIGGPVGSIVEWSGSTLPVGYEWPNGQTLASAALYPDFNAATGSLVTVDRRGYTAAGVDNMGGAAAGRIGSVATDSGTLVGTTLKSTGGSATHTQAAGEVGQHSHGPGTLATDSQGAHTHGITEPNSGQGHQHPGGAAVGSQLLGASLTANQFGGTTPTGFATTGITINSAGAHTHSVTSGATATNAAPTPMAMFSPTIMMNYLLVVE